MNINFAQRIAALEARVENMERSQREIAGDVKKILETLNKGKGGVRVFWAVATVSTSAALLSLIKSFTT